MVYFFFLMLWSNSFFHAHRPDPAPPAVTEGTLQRCVSCTQVTKAEADSSSKCQAVLFQPVVLYCCDVMKWTLSPAGFTAKHTTAQRAQDCLCYCLDFIFCRKGNWIPLSCTWIPITGRNFSCSQFHIPSEGTGQCCRTCKQASNHL